MVPVAVSSGYIQASSVQFAGADLRFLRTTRVHPAFAPRASCRLVEPNLMIALERGAVVLQPGDTAGTVVASETVARVLLAMDCTMRFSAPMLMVSPADSAVNAVPEPTRYLPEAVKEPVPVTFV